MYRLCLLSCSLAFLTLSASAAEKSPLEFPPPKTPQEALASFQVHPGFEVQLVAAEPLVVDPVAVDWGADGTLWVAEMRDYPMGMDGNWKPGSRIKCLRSSKNDGHYDKATVFLDNLPFVTGVTAWRKGALISAAPDIIYAEDTDGDGRADLIKNLFTGFDTGNYQARVNSLALGLDNWIYGANGLRGGTIRGQSRAIGRAGASKGEPVEVDIRGRDFRMNPDTGAFEPASGLTQQGRCRDDWGNWFGCDNSTAAWHYPIPDHYLRRNPHVPAPSPRVAIAAGPNGNLLYPVSHTLERFNNPGAVNRVTSGCGIGIYRDTLLGSELYGNAFVCEPVHNLVHRMVLRPAGATFSAVRAPDEADSEFLSSRDNWFRPVQARTGPDGALWVVDMYRFVIEHPRWIPPERLAKLDVRAGEGKGRIYRVIKKGEKLRPIPDLAHCSSAELAAMLDTANGTERDRIHQELVFPASARRPLERDAVKALERLSAQSQLPAVRVQALCVLDGLHKLSPALVERALSDTNPALRANAIRLSQEFAHRHSSPLLKHMLNLANDPDMRVRYQLALSLGEWDDSAAGQALAALARQDAGDEWMRAAILSSATRKTSYLLKALASSPQIIQKQPAFMSQVIATAAGEGGAKSLPELLNFLSSDRDSKFQSWQLTAFASVLDALGREKISIDEAVAKNSQLKAKVGTLLEAAYRLAGDTNAKTSERVAAAQLLGREKSRSEGDLQLLLELLASSTPLELQKASLEALKRDRSPHAGTLVLAKWETLSFAIRPAALALLLSREDWTHQLLSAVESGKVGRNEVPLANRQLLAKSRNQEVRALAEKIWPLRSSDRAEVIKKYEPALKLIGDPFKGRAVWAKNCVICHYFRGEGASVGPNLGALTDKTPADFLTAILDPNAVVEPRFVAYNLELKDGRSLTGIISAETATTLTLAQAGGTMEKILRSDITEIRPSRLSLMPEGLEQNIGIQDMANLIAYLNNAPHPLGSAAVEQAAQSKQKFTALTHGTDLKLHGAAERTPRKSWLGELPLAKCSQPNGKLAWQVTVLQPHASKEPYEIRIPVAMGHRQGSAAGTFALAVNGTRMLDFGVALHDAAWQSADGKVSASFFVMEDSADESHGILTISVQPALVPANGQLQFEVTSASAAGSGWFGVFDLGEAGSAGPQSLFDGKTLAGWKKPTGEWMPARSVSLNPTNEEKFLVSAGQGLLCNGPLGKSVNLVSESEFGDAQIHVEFWIPEHSNSGVYVMGRYEIQIYDIEVPKYPGMECGGIYGRAVGDQTLEGHSPRVNVSKPPGQWQSFDITFRAPRFDPSGHKLEKAKMVKVLHNGVLVHENVELNGPTRSAMALDEKALGPIMLQGNHGPVAFRNVTVEKLRLD
jgi:putative membrane-bound dehydrogenase-like protein